MCIQSNGDISHSHCPIHILYFPSLLLLLLHFSLVAMSPKSHPFNCALCCCVLLSILPLYLSLAYVRSLTCSPIFAIFHGDEHQMVAYTQCIHPPQVQAVERARKHDVNVVQRCGKRSMPMDMDVCCSFVQMLCSGRLCSVAIHKASQMIRFTFRQSASYNVPQRTCLCIFALGSFFEQVTFSVLIQFDSHQQ